MKTLKQRRERGKQPTHIRLSAHSLLSHRRQITPSCLIVLSTHARHRAEASPVNQRISAADRHADPPKRARHKPPPLLSAHAHTPAAAAATERR